MENNVQVEKVDEEVCQNCTYSICDENCPLKQFLEMDGEKE